jgi:prevent-host-death family protein
MGTLIVNTHEAKSRLSELIRLVETGEEVFVARNGVTVAQIVSADAVRPKRVPGLWKGKLQPMAPEEWAAADQEVLSMFEESSRTEVSTLKVPAAINKKAKAKR